jgi:hypothetical protein
LFEIRLTIILSRTRHVLLESSLRFEDHDATPVVVAPPRGSTMRAPYRSPKFGAFAECANTVVALTIPKFRFRGLVAVR